MISTAAKVEFKTFIYRHPVKVEVGTERFITTKEIGGKVVATNSRVDTPLNNNGQEVYEGWLGSWTDGDTTTDHHAHGSKTVVKVEAMYDWDHELDQPEKQPYGYEITWN